LPAPRLACGKASGRLTCIAACAQAVAARYTGGAAG